MKCQFSGKVFCDPPQKIESGKDDAMYALAFFIFVFVCLFKKVAEGDH